MDSSNQASRRPLLIRFEYFVAALLVAIISTGLAVHLWLEQPTEIVTPSSPSLATAKSLITEGRFKEAIVTLEEAADNGSPEAHLELGRLYEYGLGVEADRKRAFAHYLTAAELGDPEGQQTVAESYAYGYGVKQDVAKASEWAARAAEARRQEQHENDLEKQPEQPREEIPGG